MHPHTRIAVILIYVKLRVLLYHNCTIVLLSCMSKNVSQFWSIILITLSEPIIRTKREAIDRIKLRSIYKGIRKLQKMDFDTHKRSNQSSDAHSYMSISDFKPLSNVYSSVKMQQQDFSANQFQTKRDKIKQILQQKPEHCRLEDWMIARKAKSVLVQDYPRSDYCSKSILNYSQEAVQAIKMQKFQKFCDSSLKKKTGMFLMKQKKPLRHKNLPMEDSLTHLDDTKIELAIDIFEILLIAGGEKQAENPVAWYVWKFINLVFDEGEDMHEEAYFQVIKQISSGRTIYYQILACLSATLQPSARMYLPLLNFIYYQSIEPDFQHFNPYHNFIFFSLIKSFACRRRAPPCIFQLSCYMNLRKVPLLISFPRENIFFMEFYSTVEQILTELEDLYGLNREQKYLFNIEGVLLETGSILDGLNRAHKFESPEEWLQRYAHFQGFSAFIVIKNMMRIDKSQENFLIMYNYIVNQYKRGLFAVTNKASFEIGGLIIASEIEMEDYCEFSLAKYTPRKKYHKGVTKQRMLWIEKQVIKQYVEFKGTKTQARQKILEILSKSKAYLTHFFLCNIFIDEQEATQAWVGVKPSSLLLVEPGTSRILRSIKYETIRQWGKSASELCLKIDNLGILHIECYTIDVLASVFSSYLAYIYSTLEERPVGPASRQRMIVHPKLSKTNSLLQSN